LLICCLYCLWPAPLAAADAPQEEYFDVKTDPAGGVIATARLVFPASPLLLQSLLTDYPHWPDLFEVRMRIVDLQVAPGVVTTDLRIDHALLPGERRLVTESRVAPGAIYTDLVAGDFKRYHRVWRLAPLNEGRETRADFELTVAIDSILPDWLVAMAMRRELEAHFRIVKDKARALAARPEK
jgi:ribosome-associated toxin RatA of RatAB toxin-antitoxin module